MRPSSSKVSVAFLAGGTIFLLTFLYLVNDNIFLSYTTFTKVRYLFIECFFYLGEFCLICHNLCLFDRLFHNLFNIIRITFFFISFSNRSTLLSIACKKAVHLVSISRSVRMFFITLSSQVGQNQCSDGLVKTSYCSVVRPRHMLQKQFSQYSHRIILSVSWVKFILHFWQVQTSLSSSVFSILLLFSDLEDDLRGCCCGVGLGGIMAGTVRCKQRQSDLFFYELWLNTYKFIFQKTQEYLFPLYIHYFSIFSLYIQSRNYFILGTFKRPPFCLTGNDVCVYKILTDKKI